jgi:5-methylcytosine-specific restriction protein B
MNLAHVERYFADILSGMESREPTLPNLRRDAEGYWRISADGPVRIPVPKNLFVVGTVNIDETTYLFSPKVLDRSNTIEFRVTAGDLSSEARKPRSVAGGDGALVRGFLAIASDDDWHLKNPASGLETLVQSLTRLHSVLAAGGFEFGHRVFYEAIRYGAMLEATGLSDPYRALDDQVMQKILPRLHGSRRKLEPTLCAVGRFCFDLEIPEGTSTLTVGSFDPLSPSDEAPRLVRSFEKIRRMTRNLRSEQFTSFTEQ